MQLRQYQEGHINWFYTKNKSLTIIWRPSWILTTLVIRKFFKNISPFLSSSKNMYSGKFCISLITRSWDKTWKFLFLGVGVGVGVGVGGGGGAVLWIFMRGSFSSYNLFSSQKAFRMSTLFECRYLEDNFLVQSGDYCIHEYKICFCREVYISPYPKIVIFKNLCGLTWCQIYQFCIFVILDITAFWKNIVCIVLQLFVPAAAVYLLICV